MFEKILEHLDFGGVLLFIIVIIISQILYAYLSIPSGIPPFIGRWMPFMGHLQHIALTKPGAIQRKLAALSKETGPLTSIYLGRRLAMYVNDFDAIKEVYVKNEDFAIERITDFLRVEVFKQRGVEASSGLVWQEHRRITLHMLRDFGMGKNIMEDKIHQECDAFIDFIEKNNRQLDGLGTVTLINNAFMNIVRQFVFGERIEYDHPEVGQVVDYMESILGFGMAGEIFPILRYLPGDVTGYNTIKARSVEMHKIYRKKLDEFMKTLDPNNIRGLIDGYLVAMGKKERGRSSTFDYDNLCQLIDDMYIAGGLTTPTTFRWIFLVMLAYPEVQEKARESVVSVVGSEGKLSMKNKYDMPYIEAVLQEVMRYAIVVQLTDGNIANKDLKVGGYLIPKGTWIYANYTAVFFNEQLFPNPWEFRPERHIDANGKFQRSPYVIPFHTGKRSCAGESLARMEMLLFTTRILQRYRLKLPEGEKCPELIHQGMYCEPPMYGIIAELL